MFFIINNIHNNTKYYTSLNNIYRGFIYHIYNLSNKERNIFKNLSHFFYITKTDAFLNRKIQK